MARRKITVECRIIMEDGRDIPFEDMTTEEHERWEKRASERLSRAMSDYVAQHPEEYHLIPGKIVGAMGMT